MRWQQKGVVAVQQQHGPWRVQVQLPRRIGVPTGTGTLRPVGGGPCIPLCEAVVSRTRHAVVRLRVHASRTPSFVGVGAAGVESKHNGTE